MKEFIIIILMSFIAFYLLFAFVSWDLMWVNSDSEAINFARAIYCVLSIVPAVSFAIERRIK